MKKLVLIIMLMALGLPSTFSQDLNIKCLATSFKYSPNDGKNWTDWYNVKIVVTITDDLIIVYSNETQVYKLEGFIKIPHGDYVNYATNAMDYSGKHLDIILSINTKESAHYISFLYSDVRYIYAIEDY